MGVGARYVGDSNKSLFGAKDLRKDIERLRQKFIENTFTDDATPIDLWARFNPPSLPPGMLPQIIEGLAHSQGMTMGADMAGIAVSALAVCAAAIPDSIQLQVKKHDTRWLESARIWIALIGLPSTKKTPIIKEAVAPLLRIDSTLAKDNSDRRASYNKLSPEDRKKTDVPTQTQVMLQNTTIEAASEIFKDSPDGLLCYHDELAGFFGAMDKYSGGRASATDRAFWLQTVPEPSTWAMMASGLCALGAAVRRRRR